MWFQNGSGVMLQHRDSNYSESYACTVLVRIDTQTEGMFSGRAGFDGVSPNSDKNCLYSSPFTGEITPDGTVTGLRLERSFNTFDCIHVADGSVTGTASSTVIHIEVTDRATCRYPPGDPRAPFIKDADRILNISVMRR
jgi:hypothetical protein